MKSYPAACLLLFSTLAFANCEKIDYVEVKDWPVAKVEQEYCKTFSEKWAMPAPKLDDFHADGTPTPRAKIMLDALNVCNAQGALYIRVLENIHKRGAPFCGAAGGVIEHGVSK
jgi:hypothetical protein